MGAPWWDTVTNLTAEQYAQYTYITREGNTMNAQQAAHVISEVAQSMGADVYAPSAWGDRDSSAYAVVLSPHHCLVMVNTDDLMDGYQITAYKYATPGGVVTRASQVMPALVTEDGDSVDPTGSGTADVASGDVAAATRAAIHAAFGA